MTTTIVKWGNSRGIRLPKPFLENLNLKENDMVDIFTDDDTIIIKKSVTHKHKTLKQRAEEFYGKDFETVLKENPYKYEEVDWGTPVGKEVW
jgi:antitoxin MazE